MVGNVKWKFEDYYFEILYAQEMIFVHGMSEYRDLLIEEMWQFYPQECVEYGLSQGD